MFLFPWRASTTEEGFTSCSTTSLGVKSSIYSPYISDVDTLSTNVSQAFYDKTKDALIVTLEPADRCQAGPVHGEAAGSDKTYTVTRNGKVVGQLDRKPTAIVTTAGR
jgi:hypothetical protein